MAQIFISYSRKDLSFVEQLAADLRDAGYEVWYDVSGLRGGSRWRFEIENAIRNSEFAIFVLSPNSIASEWVEREFLFSSNLKRKLIPLMYQPCELPLSYLNLNYIDVHGDNYKRSFNEILEALGSEQATSSAQGLRNLPSRPVSKEIKKLNPVLFAGALVVIGILIGSSLLVRRFYLSPAQNIIETSPTTPILFTVTAAPTFTLEPTLTAVLPTNTAPAARLGDFWISYDSNLNGNRDIFLLNPATGENTAVITDPSHDKVGSWSPDGKLLAFESNRDSVTYQIYLFNHDQESIRSLTELAECSNWAPTWSPDGEKIVFYSNCENNQRDIYMMNRDGSGRQRLTSASGENRFPVFSPDGKTITFTSSRNGRDQIWLMNADGGNPRPAADGCSSTFSPDGKWLWFSARCEDSDIKRMEIAGTNLSTIGNIFGQNPSVSPDGGFVVFQSNNDIWIMNIDGSEPAQLTSGSALDGAPSWRP
jgi:Tol biopolymer transport system component